MARGNSCSLKLKALSLIFLCVFVLLNEGKCKGPALGTATDECENSNEMCVAVVDIGNGEEVQMDKNLAAAGIFLRLENGNDKQYISDCRAESTVHRIGLNIWHVHGYDKGNCQCEPMHKIQDGCHRNEACPDGQICETHNANKKLFQPNGNKLTDASLGQMKSKPGQCVPNRRRSMDVDAESSDFVVSPDDKPKIENDGRDLPIFQPRTARTESLHRVMPLATPTAIASADVVSVFIFVGIFATVVFSLVGIFVVIAAVYECCRRFFILAKPVKTATTVESIDKTEKRADMKVIAPVTLDSVEKIVEDACRRTLMELLDRETLRALLDKESAVSTIATKADIANPAPLIDVGKTPSTTISPLLKSKNIAQA